MDQDPSKMDSDQSGMLHTPTAPSPFSQTAADTLSFSTFSDVSSFRPSTLSWKKNSDFRGYRPEDIQMADGYSAYPTNIDIGSAIDSGLYELSSSTGQLYRLPQPEIPAPPPPMNNSSHLFGTGSGRTFFCQMCQAAFPSLSGLIQHTPVCQGDRLSSGFGDMEGARDGALTGVMEEVTKRERPGSDDPGFLGELTVCFLWVGLCVQCCFKKDIGMAFIASVEQCVLQKSVPVLSSSGLDTLKLTFVTLHHKMGCNVSSVLLQ